MANNYLGIPASPGIAIGPAVVFKCSVSIPDYIPVKKDDIPFEIKKLEEALKKAEETVERKKSSLNDKIKEEDLEIYDSHILMLKDPEFLAQTKELIMQKNASASWALWQVLEKFIREIENAGNPYLELRTNDIQDIRAQVLRALANEPEPDWSNLPTSAILVASKWSPSDIPLIERHRDYIAGILSDKGGAESHFSILLRNLGIPGVTGLKKFCKIVKTGQTVALNAKTGEVFLKPENNLIRRLQQEKELWRMSALVLRKYIGRPSVTRDGHRVPVLANIREPQDIPLALENDAEGIGLFRTEFLFLNRAQAPSEDEQFEIYKNILKQMGNRPVVIRTIDAGGDKPLPFLDLPKEDNPVLGLRAIRLCFQYPEIFKAQLRALLRASPFGNLEIMFPLISSLEEVLDIKKILSEAASDLQKEGFSIRSCKIGIMIEVPSAAICAADLAKHVDFFSIGTNDLAQYLLAADRQNEFMKSHYNIYHPALLRTIHSVVQSARAQGIRVGLCGGLASREEFTPFLVGSGIHDLSVDPNAVLPIRAAISRMSYPEAVLRAKQLLELAKAQDIREELSNTSSHAATPVI